MTREEILLKRLAGQHLLAPGDSKTVVQDLCGLQAQFLGHALHGLSIRSREMSTDGMVKSWTIRGTMHLFSEKDLPLFLHKGRSHFLRPEDTMEGDEFLSADRKSYFADLILKAVAQGIDRREELKTLCETAGMTETEGKRLFDPWGGIIRALCESGRLCHKVQKQKAYALCPSFVPMEEEPARLELARRYFTHFGPATVRDAAHFFGTTQEKVKSWLKQLPVTETEYRGKQFYSLCDHLPTCEMPDVLFLAGFDQLMLGYEKIESLFLPGEHLREIFTLAGIVRPAVLVNGTVAGWWKRQNRKLSVTLWEGSRQAPVTEAAERLWPDLRTIEFL